VSEEFETGLVAHLDALAPLAAALKLEPGGAWAENATNVLEVVIPAGGETLGAAESQITAVPPTQSVNSLFGGPEWSKFVFELDGVDPALAAAAADLGDAPATGAYTKYKLRPCGADVADEWDVEIRLPALAAGQATPTAADVVAAAAGAGLKLTGLPKGPLAPELALSPDEVWSRGIVDASGDVVATLRALHAGASGDLELEVTARPADGATPAEAEAQFAAVAAAAKELGAAVSEYAATAASAAAPAAEAVAAAATEAAAAVASAAPARAAGLLAAAAAAAAALLA
jgi:hypothetical protein